MPLAPINIAGSSTAVQVHSHIAHRPRRSRSKIPGITGRIEQGLRVERQYKPGQRILTHSSPPACAVAALEPDLSDLAKGLGLGLGRGLPDRQPVMARSQHTYRTGNR